MQRYSSRLSGPLLDRIDIQVEVPRINHEQLQQGCPGESSAAIRERMEQAQQRQRERFKHLKILSNAQMRGRHLNKYSPLASNARRLLVQAIQSLGLSSMRAYDRIIKVAAPSPIWPAPRPSKPPTSPKRSSTAASTEQIVPVYIIIIKDT